MLGIGETSCKGGRFHSALMNESTNYDSLVDKSAAFAVATLFAQDCCVDGEDLF